MPMPAPRDLLRFTTAGSVDDGKSTLIGRLLHDTRAVFEDQLAQVEAASRRLGADRTNLALLTDGLRAEREQQITIDVAYRSFSTPRRRFIIADTPGHVQYTRNMVTGASTADLAVILIDASRGAQTQSRRHAFIASLLGIPHLVVAVNKMDLVGYSQEAYEAIVRDFTAFASRLTVKDVTFVPVSALEGDNVVARSTRLPWYEGGSLLHRLETVTVGGRANTIDFRFPVQLVIRADGRFRGYAGTVASGGIRAGDEIVVLPSGQATRVKAIEAADGARAEARAGEAIVLTTTEEIDIARGDMLVRTGNLPTSATRVEAYLCWMHAEPLRTDVPYVMLHTTRQLEVLVRAVTYRVDVDTLHRQPASTLTLNEIGRVEVDCGQALCFDSYRVNAATGSFVLVDPHTNATVAAGMIRGEARGVRRAGDATALPSSTNVHWEGWNISREERETTQGHQAAVVWLTGLPGAGKSTIARRLERRLFERGVKTMLLDGDQLRHGLNGDLQFSPADRAENIRRAGEVARLFFEQGSVVVCAFVSPYRADRARVRALLPRGRFLEVFVEARPETCRARDPKGLYARAEQGHVTQFTGVSAPYEAPDPADLRLDTDALTVDQSVDAIMRALTECGWVR